MKIKNSTQSKGKKKEIIVKYKNYTAIFTSKDITFEAGSHLQTINAPLKSYKKSKFVPIQATIPRGILPKVIRALQKSYKK